jgi:hypothetical protein
MFWCLHGENFQKKLSVKFPFFFFNTYQINGSTLGSTFGNYYKSPSIALGYKTRFKYGLEYGIPTNYPKNLLINSS